MHPLLFSTFLLPTIVKCTSLVDQTISDLDQSDPRLATFIKEKLLEPPPIFPENVEDMNMEVNIILKSVTVMLEGMKLWWGEQ